MPEDLVSPPQDFDDAASDDAPVLARKPMSGDSEIDITPMIDCVFLLLIFFLVTSTPDQNTAIELPPAQYGQGVSQKTSVIITIAKREGDRPAAVYLADGTIGTPLPDDPKQQEAALVEAVEREFGSGLKTDVLIKAARDVKARDVDRVTQGVSKAAIEDLRLNIAVFEEN